ncbi:MAG: hypothetical protein JO262_20870 [Solirubrobacterales bacterium]|nr:hypothetical protein [Solirubrobacterales bacterium]
MAFVLSASSPQIQAPDEDTTGGGPLARRRALPLAIGSIARLDTGSLGAVTA